MLRWVISVSSDVYSFWSMFKSMFSYFILFIHNLVCELFAFLAGYSWHRFPPGGIYYSILLCWYSFILFILSGVVNKNTFMSLVYVWWWPEWYYSNVHSPPDKKYIFPSLVYLIWWEDLYIQGIKYIPLLMGESFLSLVSIFGGTLSKTQWYFWQSNKEI